MVKPPFFNDESYKTIKFQLAQGVQVTPAECASGDSSVRQRCKFSCPAGHRLLGSRAAKCRRDGVWKSNGGPPKCVAVPDETPMVVTTTNTPTAATTASPWTTKVSPRLTTLAPSETWFTFRQRTDNLL